MSWLESLHIINFEAKHRFLFFINHVLWKFILTGFDVILTFVEAVDDLEVTFDKAFGN